MSMHQGLDLSRFKKVSSDKKTTVLRHAKGHELKIAHAALTPKMREQLEALETHEDRPKKMAGGGDPADPQAPTQDMDPSSPAPLSDNGSPAANAAPEQGDPLPPYLNNQTDTAEYLQQSAEPGTAAPQVEPQAAPQPAPRKTAAQIAAEMNQHDLEWQQDLDKGMIKPETYKSLFAKQDTLGKIGTIFGLLVGGAGSGLAHQPNMAMDMINKTLERDFEAQKQSKANAFNFYQLSKKQAMQEAMQKAQIERMGVENQATLAGIPKTKAEAELTQAQTKGTIANLKKIPADIARTYAEARNIDQEANIRSNTNMATRTMSAAFQSLKDTADKLPPGPQKDAAYQQLGLLYPMFQQNIIDKNAHASGMIGLGQTMTGEPDNGAPQSLPPGQNTQGGNYQKLHQLENRGSIKLPNGMKIPNSASPEQVEKAKAEMGEIQEVRSVAGQYFDSFHKLKNMVLHGALTPGKRAAEINTIVDMISHTTTKRFNQAAAAGQAEGMLPSPGDLPPTVDEKLRKGAEFFRSKEADAPTLDYFKLRTPWPFEKELSGAGSKPQLKDGESKQETNGGSQPKKQYKEGDTDTFHGKPIIYQNGKWKMK